MAVSALLRGRALRARRRTDGDGGVNDAHRDGAEGDEGTSAAGVHDGRDDDEEGRLSDGDTIGGGGCAEEADELGGQSAAEHVQRAGGNVDGRLGELMTAAAEGTAVVYEEQPPPAGTPTDGVPEGEEAAAQRRGWLNDARDDELFETLRAVSSGAYALQPIRLEDGELTPFEEAVAGIVGRASPASASSVRMGASGSRGSAEALAPTPTREASGSSKRARNWQSSSARKRAKAEAARSSGGTTSGVTGRLTYDEAPRP